VKLSGNQQELLDALSESEWRTAPLLTKSATILSLEKRGLIKMRMPERYRKGILTRPFIVPYITYGDYELLKLPDRSKG
jgi:hypothetical protein